MAKFSVCFFNTMRVCISNPDVGIDNGWTRNDT